ncbi:flagellar basal body P-ring formation chaperone FlgA [Thermotoga sp.]|uniref:flagellar basal body P-ring formation chaperone FlgA n=1 Tax=Thermotoga sp. TaxID=28240 RepID=UPI0025D02BF4|nr:flagellar basal body P-ring formation chaperone FlgA [Thermotoga sp.]MCD6551204.1 flagellar basal body P-ring formation protein FlgA [Thermotoga sp.]
MKVCFLMLVVLFSSFLLSETLMLRETLLATPGVLSLNDLTVEKVGSKKSLMVLLPGFEYLVSRDFLAIRFPEYKFVGPDQVKITVKGPDELRKVVCEEIEKKVGTKDFEVFVVKTFGKFPQDLDLSSVRVTRISKNLINVFLKFTDGSYVTLNVVLRKERNVVVLKRNINVGDVIKEDFVTVERRDIFEINGEPFYDISEVVGMVSRRYLRVGAVLTRNMLENPPDVIKGQIVPAYVDLGSIKVSTFVEVVENGYLGETVKAMNIESRKYVFGKVEKGPVLRILGVTE